MQKYNMRIMHPTSERQINLMHKMITNTATIFWAKGSRFNKKGKMTEK